MDLPPQQFLNNARFRLKYKTEIIVDSKKLSSLLSSNGSIQWISYKKQPKESEKDTGLLFSEASSLHLSEYFLLKFHGMLFSLTAMHHFAERTGQTKSVLPAHVFQHPQILQGSKARSVANIKYLSLM